MDANGNLSRNQIRLNTKNPREAAYLALLISLREESFISEVLARWKEESEPSKADFNFAQEIAYGTSRMALALDFIAGKLANSYKLNLKLREKVLIRSAIYQACYMDRVPIYAITNESVEIAKKYCHRVFVRFLNAALHRLADNIPPLPEGNTVPEMSIRYSYPPYYVQELLQNYGQEKAIEILEAGNRPAPVMFRVRPQSTNHIEEKEGIELLTGTITPIAILRETNHLKTIAESPDYYIQNATPAVLIQTLAQNSPKPKRVLDLCASPGGKLLGVHDIFPDAALFANDVSPEKLKRLSENCAKYGMKAVISCSSGEEFQSSELFDLVILDVPCSNSGVLNKRPEARWRLSLKTLEQLEQLQLRLIKNAVSLIKDDGEIWYLTCSVLKRENSRIIEKVCALYNLKVRAKETVLPNLDGWDGGYACALQKQS